MRKVYIYCVVERLFLLYNDIRQMEIDLIGLRPTTLTYQYVNLSIGKPYVVKCRNHSGEDKRGNREDPTSYTGFEQKLRQRRCIKVTIFRVLIVKSYVF